MNANDKKQAAIVESAFRPQAEVPLHNEKESLPGQQIGLYCEANQKDVSQMVSMMNSPAEEGQGERG